MVGRNGDAQKRHNAALSSRLMNLRDQDGWWRCLGHITTNHPNTSRQLVENMSRFNVPEHFIDLPEILWAGALKIRPYFSLFFYNIHDYLYLREIEMVSGKKYYMLNNYTYSYRYRTKYGAKWRCTKTSVCHAYIIVNDDGALVKICGAHNHHPRKYVLTEDGQFVHV